MCPSAKPTVTAVMAVALGAGPSALTARRLQPTGEPTTELGLLWAQAWVFYPLTSEVQGASWDLREVWLQLPLRIEK